MISTIILGVLFFLVLCLIAFIVCNKWSAFRDLRPGDTCGKLVDNDLACEITTEDVIKVDVDELGYTNKVYTTNGVYTFLDFIKKNIFIIYD